MKHSRHEALLDSKHRACSYLRQFISWEIVKPAANYLVAGLFSSSFAIKR